MRAQESGSIVNISSVAAVASSIPLTAYKISKAGINALTHSLAIANAKEGIRVNAIMPGLLDTPNGGRCPGRCAAGPARGDRGAARRPVPLRGRMGTGWDVAYASRFLHSDEAGFITGVVLPVDGGQLARVGG